MAYTMTRCGEYHTYQKQIGSCDAKQGSACHAEKMEHADGAMSYVIEKCG